MGLSGLSAGYPGAFEAGLIALAIGFAFGLAAGFAGARLDWRPGTAFGVATAAALAVGAGIDAWTLFYLGAVRLESPFVIARTLGAIADPAFLGARVVFECIGAALGAPAGVLAAEAWRRRRRD